MDGAQPFPKALAFVEECVRRRIDVFIVSHRTRLPYRGAPTDLHAAANAWLRRERFVATTALAPDRVFLEETSAAKIERIRALRCTHFIDDLPELMTNPAFPSDTVAILFDPHDAGVAPRLRRLRRWDRAAPMLLEGGTGE
jgi:hypothetical protein